MKKYNHFSNKSLSSYENYLAIRFHRTTQILKKETYIVTVTQSAYVVTDTAEPQRIQDSIILMMSHLLNVTFSRNKYALF